MALVHTIKSADGEYGFSEFREIVKVGMDSHKQRCKTKGNSDALRGRCVVRQYAGQGYVPLSSMPYKKMT
jgi:hypothetical protein